jgi:preprotein translocase subunit SecE
VAQITPTTTSQSTPERPEGPGPIPPLGESAAAGTDEPEAIAAEGKGFLAQTLAELRMVVWPSRQQLFSESVAVILMVALSAAAIAVVDRFFHWASIQVFR